jgi:hypothetical protein
MPVMGMMMLGLEPRGSHTSERGSGGEVAVDDDSVSMMVSTTNSPDVMLDFGVGGEFLVPAGTIAYFPFARAFTWRAANGEDAQVGAIWFKLTRNGELKRKLGL